MSNKFHEIATIISDKCINSETKRPFSVEMIEQSMRDLHVNVKANRSAKQQALDVITILQKSLPIARTQMRVRVECAASQAKQVKGWLKTQEEGTFTIEREDLAAPIAAELVLLIDPGLYRGLDGKVQEVTRGQGHVEVLDHRADAQDDEDDDELKFDDF